MTEEIISEARVLQIGRLVVSVSKIESLLTDIVGAVTDINTIMSVVLVHHQQASSKIDSLLAIFDLLFQGKSNSITGLLNETKTICDFRNTIVHAHWTVDNDSITHAVRFSARGKFKRTKTPYTADQIQERADEASALIPKLIDLRDHFREPTSDSPPGD